MGGERWIVSDRWRPVSLYSPQPPEGGFGEYRTWRFFGLIEKDVSICDKYIHSVIMVL